LLYLGRGVPIIETLSCELREEAVREALGELRAEALVYFGGRIFRGAVHRAIQFNRGATGSDGEAVEGGGEIVALDQGGVGFQAGIRPPFTACAGFTEYGPAGVRGALGPPAVPGVRRRVG
jgi:hypothetical protein